MNDRGKILDRGVQKEPREMVAARSEAESRAKGKRSLG